MKKYSLFFLFCILACLAGNIASAQKQRSYTSGNFQLYLPGQEGYLKPIKKNDTLIYTVQHLSDSTLIRKQYDSLFKIKGKKYFLKYNLKKQR
ncbi:MAG: hypothetical protein ABIP30_09175 [Ferruginibacter sp.]